MNAIPLSGLARRLVKDGIISEDTAQDAFSAANKDSVPFVSYLAQNNLADTRQIAEAASDEFGTPLLDLSAYDSWWRSELLAQGLAPERADEAVERVADSVQNVLSDQIGRWLLSPEREQALSEFPLSSLLPDGRLAEYVIDRTFVADGQRWVVDYKSAMPESGQSLEAFLSSEEASYRAQLDNYARLLAELFGEPVRSALYFTAIPHWHVLN